MNLLLTQGDYDKAKKELKQLIWKRDNLHGSDSFTQHMKMQCDILSKILLAYRRQHNIFEIGDLYVFTEKYSKHSAIHKVNSLKSGKGCIRHATDEEIASGRRL